MGIASPHQLNSCQNFNVLKQINDKTKQSDLKISEFDRPHDYKFFAYSKLSTLESNSHAGFAEYVSTEGESAKKNVARREKAFANRKALKCASCNKCEKTTETCMYIFVFVDNIW